MSSLAAIGSKISSLRAPRVPPALLMDTGRIHTSGNKQPSKISNTDLDASVSCLGDSSFMLGRSHNRTFSTFSVATFVNQQSIGMNSLTRNFSVGQPKYGPNLLAGLGLALSISRNSIITDFLSDRRKVKDIKMEYPTKLQDWEHSFIGYEEQMDNEQVKLLTKRVKDYHDGNIPKDSQRFMGFLLWGPNGIGKRYFAKALAANTGASFMAIDQKDFNDDPKKLPILLRKAKNPYRLPSLIRQLLPHQQVCFIFIENLDAAEDGFALKLRHEIRHAKNGLFLFGSMNAEHRGIESTNFNHFHEGNIFNSQILKFNLDPPEIRKKLWKRCLGLSSKRNLCLADDVEKAIDDFVAESKAFTPAHIHNAVEEARRAARPPKKHGFEGLKSRMKDEENHEEFTITARHFFEAISNLRRTDKFVDKKIKDAYKWANFSATKALLKYKKGHEIDPSTPIHLFMDCYYSPRDNENEMDKLDQLLNKVIKYIREQEEPKISMSWKEWEDKELMCTKPDVYEEVVKAIPIITEFKNERDRLTKKLYEKEILVQEDIRKIMEGPTEPNHDDVKGAVPTGTFKELPNSILHG